MSKLPIKTPKPPLNIFNVARQNIAYIAPTGTAPDLVYTWTDLYEVDTYEIPATPISAARLVDTAAIMTGLLISNLSNVDVEVSVRIQRTSGVAPSQVVEYFTLLHKFPIPRRDFASVKLDRQMLKPGEVLQAICWTDAADEEGERGNDVITTHLSYILNQAEEYTVLP